MLPIKKIVLYKHGVGYFERAGAIQGDTTIELSFKAAEMNDVLKSLTVLDLGGGLITSISYESTKPIERQLEDIAIHLPRDNALSGFLTQIQGARVTVEVGSSMVEGTITGLETITRHVEQEVVESKLLSLLVEGSTLRSFDLMDCKRITFSDPALQKDLQHLLDTLIASKKKDLKRLTIFASGQGQRELLASYLLETPVWKTSYRLLLEEKQPLIQGWALVDNTQDEDWEKVSLTLVSGLPISFVHDLYSPRYKARPVVKVAEETAYAPPVLEEAMWAESEEELAVDEFAAESTPTGMVAAARMRSSPRPPMPQGPAAPARRKARRQSVEVQTRTVAVGDLFQYQIANAVTVKRNQSALVPILQCPFSGKRVAVYNPEVRDKNPMSAVLFKNTSGMTLEGGPVTVLEEEVYVGEAMLETMKPDEERLVPFSVELGCLVTVDQQQSQRQNVHFARLHQGTLHLHRFCLEETIYRLKSKLEKPLDLYLEHRSHHEFELVDTPQPVETTEHFYRFRLQVPPREQQSFAVKERRVEQETWSIRQANHDQVTLWLSHKYIDQATQKQLEQLITLNEKVSSFNYWIQQREEEIQQIFTNQQRLRENLQALGSSQDERGLRERYVQALSQEEDQLLQLRGQIQEWKKDKATTEGEIGALVKGLTFTTKL